ncbi:hypothetical protein [Microbacterium marinum]
MSIEHTVVFRLVHAPGSDAVDIFLDDAKRMPAAFQEYDFVG